MVYSLYPRRQRQGCGMRFMHLVDIDGKHHLVNPLHIAAIHETDAGCVLHLRGRNQFPIQLNETVELMGDALDSPEVERESTLLNE